MSKVSRRTILAGLATAPIAATMPVSAGTSDWRPTEAMRIIAPALPGGITDTIARMLSRHLTAVWGRPAIVENRPGAAGTIGASETLRQKADGLTIFIGNGGANAIAYSLFPSMPYRPEQFQPVSNIIRIPNIIAVTPSLGIKDIRGLIDYGRAHPDKLNYATSGIGQTPHLAAVLFLQSTGMKMGHLPFRGAAPALASVLGGQVEVLFDNLFPALNQAEAGKLRILAVTTDKRSARAPDIPTMKESASELSKYDLGTWIGAFVRAGTSAAAVEAINSEIKAMLAKDEIRKALYEMGAWEEHSPVSEFEAFVLSETQKFERLIKAEGLALNTIE